MAIMLDKANYNRTSDFIIPLRTVLQVSNLWQGTMCLHFYQINTVNFLKFTV